MKELIAAILSICIVGGTLPAVYSGAPECAVTAFAETDYQGNEYEEFVDDSLTYRVYADHAELIQCDEYAEGEIIIPDEVNGVPVTNIGIYAFHNCYNITSIKIPNSVTDIGYEVFGGARSLTAIDVSEKNNNYASIDGVLFNKEKTILYTYPEGKNSSEYTIPDTVTIIGYCAFYGCINLKSIIVPDSVTSIAAQAFCDCQNLESVRIPDLVTTIGDFAFAGCESIISITIPDSVSKIGCGAFHYCTSLTSIIIMNPECNIDWSERTITNGRDDGVYYFNGTIYGYDGSTAQDYADVNGRAFKPLSELPTDEPTTGTELKKGDANGDGGVDMSDVVMVMQAYLNPAKYGVDGTSEDRITADGEKAGDVDGKAGLTANDAIIIQRYSLKLIDNF